MDYKSNTYPVFYFSKALTNLTLFIEFFFEGVLKERDEPLVAAIMLLKGYCMFREYKGLKDRERIQVMIENDTYLNYKRQKEMQESFVKL